MKIIFTWKELIVMNGNLEIDRFSANCNIRNELNGRRKKDEIVYTIPIAGHPKPYYPRQFPSGIFDISEVQYTNDSEYAPVKIKTNALREVFTWDLTRDGMYWMPTGNTQIDSAYWLHFTKSRTTLGCIRIGSESDAMNLALIVKNELDKDKSVLLEVL